MTIILAISQGQSPITFELTKTTDGWVVSQNAVESLVVLQPLYQSTQHTGWLALINNRPVELHACFNQNELQLSIRGHRFTVQRFLTVTPEGPGKSNANDGIIRAGMPGKIVETMVKVGDMVKAEQVVLLMEAMKMENELRTPCSGTVVELFVEKGQSVEVKAILMRIQPGEIK